MDWNDRFRIKLCKRSSKSCWGIYGHCDRSVVRFAIEINGRKAKSMGRI